MRRVKREMAEIAQGQDRLLRQAVADPRVFADNLDRLTRLSNLTRKQAADRIGADYQWYRRAVTRGLSRIRQRHRVYLERLAALFRLGHVDDLWKPDLIVFRVRRVGLPPQAEPQEEQDWYQEELVPVARKLGRLLATGRHEYLRELIDRLHDTLPPEARAADDDRVH